MGSVPKTTSTSSRTSVNLCTKGHTLIPYSSLQELQQEDPKYVNLHYTCDGCKLPKNSCPVMHCTQCRYDLCPECTAKCPAGHPLFYVSKLHRTELRPHHANGFSCALCNTVKQDDYSFHCHICNYDLCRACASPSPPSLSSPQASSSVRKDDQRDLEMARAWLLNIAADNDVKADNRMMTPVFYDQEKKKMKVWCVLGWGTKKLDIKFHIPPRPVAPREDITLLFEPLTVEYTYPVFAEVYTRRVLDRTEFRSLCDTHCTRSRILSAIKSL
ncbi:hypothetical protein Pelo_5420 [Pelomyxa schiedti]|nr:hypothetical protein Pelo_5420 [Pelomyxa schiedti]